MTPRRRAPRSLDWQAAVAKDLGGRGDVSLLRDPRGHTGILKELERLGAFCLTSQLGSGDVSFFTCKDESVGVEIKQADDLLGSLRGGRLFEQGARLLTDYDYPTLLRYGFMAPTREGWVRTKTGVKQSPPWPNWSQVMLALMSLASQGILVAPVQPSEFQAAIFITDLYRWYQKPMHKSIAKRQRPATFGTSEMIQGVHILTGVGGIGVDTANRLLRHFDSPLAVFEAGEEDLMQVKGVGRKTAQRIYRASRASYRGQGEGGEAK